MFRPVRFGWRLLRNPANRARIGLALRVATGFSAAALRLFGGLRTGAFFFSAAGVFEGFGTLLRLRLLSIFRGAPEPYRLRRFAAGLFFFNLVGNVLAAGVLREGAVLPYPFGLIVLSGALCVFRVLLSLHAAFVHRRERQTRLLAARSLSSSAALFSLCTFFAVLAPRFLPADFLPRAALLLSLAVFFLSFFLSLSVFSLSLTRKAKKRAPTLDKGSKGC